jgi:hypothetical protein
LKILKEAIAKFNLAHYLKRLPVANHPSQEQRGGGGVIFLKKK